MYIYLFIDTVILLSLWLSYRPGDNDLWTSLLVALQAKQIIEKRNLLIQGRM